MEMLAHMMKNAKKENEKGNIGSDEDEDDEKWERLNYLLMKMASEESVVDCEEIIAIMVIINNLAISDLVTVFDKYIKELRKTYPEISSARSLNEAFDSCTDESAKKRFRISSAAASVHINHDCIAGYIPAISQRRVQAAESALFASFFGYLKALGKTLTQPEVLALLWKIGEKFTGSAFPVAKVTYEFPPSSSL
jgi:hypothetical protein